MPFAWLFSEPLFFIAWVLAIIITLTIHEFSHAACALAFGDSTAKDAGRLTLNPLSHIDPLGFVMLLFVGFGWAKPVPISVYNLKNRRLGAAVVALAGPLSNLLGMVVFGLLFKFLAPVLGPDNLLTNFLFFVALVNVSLFVFNLLPIPPLDGSHVLFAILPDHLNNFKDSFSNYGPYVLLILLLIDSFTNIGIFSGLFNFMLSFLGWLF
jgi:Zn-dependent protease